MTDLFPARPSGRRAYTIDKSYLRGAIWLLALGLFVWLPKPADRPAADPAPIDVASR